MRIRSVLNHSLQAVLEGALIAMLVVGLMAGTALAGKRAGSTTSGVTFTGPVMVVDQNGDHAANYKDTIRFNVVTSASKPMVGLRCWQGSEFVLDGYGSYFSSRLSDGNFMLSSGYWDANASARCTARLFTFDRRGREHLLTTTLTVDVAP